MRAGKNSHLMLFLFVITGAILGGLLEDAAATVPALSPVHASLVRPFPVLEIPSFTVNLYVIKAVMGFSFFPNLASIAGIILALLVFQRI